MKKLLTDIQIRYRRAEIGARVLFLVFSMFFHLVVVDYFFQLKFKVGTGESRETVITVVPVSREQLVFPKIDKGFPVDKTGDPVLPLERDHGNKMAEKAVKETPPTKSFKLGDAGINPGRVTGVPEQPPLQQPPLEGQAVGVDESQPSAPAVRPISPLKAPFDGRHFLKSETMEEILQRVKQEELAKNKNKKEPQLTSVSLPSGGVPDPRYEDVIIDTSGRSYFKNRGYDISAWAGEAAEKINRNWSILSILKVEGQTEAGLSVTVERDGTLAAVQLQRSTEKRFLDQAAINAVNLTGTLPALPDGYPGGKLNAYFLFRYDFPGDPQPIKPGLKKDRRRGQRKPDPYIARIGLVKGGLFDTSKLPKLLVLGVESKEEVNYRLVKGEQVLEGGRLVKGMNFVDIPARRLLTRAGTHYYALDLQKGEETYRKEIRLDITCYRSGNSGQVKEDIRDAGYGLAVFVSNQLLAYHKKTVRYRQLSFQDKTRQAMHLDHLSRRAPDPHNMLGEKYQRASIPVLALPFMAYKLIKKAKEKSKPKKVKTYGRLSGTYLVRENGRDNVPLDVAIVLDVSGDVSTINKGAGVTENLDTPGDEAPEIVPSAQKQRSLVTT